MVKQINTIKSVLLGALVALLLAFTVGAVTGCVPCTDGYDWHSGEAEKEETTSKQ